jgi:hypothetical protein
MVIEQLAIERKVRFQECPAVDSQVSTDDGSCK